jgi:hypothetical protein
MKGRARVSARKMGEGGIKRREAGDGGGGGGRGGRGGGKGKGRNPRQRRGGKRETWTY